MPCVFSKPLEFVEDETRIYYEDGTIFHKRLRRFCGLSKQKNGYLQVKINKKRKYIHRLIWEKFNGEIPDGLQVDHKNHKKDDNRLVNLQLLPPDANCQRQLIYKNNTSGFKGVHFDKSIGKYRAYVMFQYKRKYLGRFLTPEEASEAYNNELNSNEKYSHYPRN